jgi:uncharacterized protein Yka (UPF0111/DUF47 family)
MGMWLADLLAPRRQDAFVTLLTEHAHKLVDAAGAFVAYAEAPSATLAARIAALEEDGDAILIRLIDELRNAFLTPLDRQDIYNLGEGMDDILDYLDGAAAEIQLFGVAPTQAVRDMARTLQAAAHAIARAVPLIQTQPQQAWEAAREARDAENIVEDAYRHALAGLFGGSDVGLMFKLREVYRHLSNAADRCEAVGRLIGKIVVKAT